MKKSYYYRLPLLLALALGMAACSEDTDFIPGESTVQTRALTGQEVVVHLPQNPVYTLGSKGSDNVYAATVQTPVNGENLTTLEVTVRVPQSVSLTGISLTAPKGKVLCGEFACNASGVTTTSASAHHQLFAGFKTAEGENHVEMNRSEGIRFTLPIAPIALKNGELAVRLHVAGSTLYETTVRQDIAPGSTVELTLDDFTATSGNQWLSLLDDETPVSRLSLPGTHDAATGEGTCLSIGVTQSLSLQAQWDMGIRVFDLRPGYKKVRKGFFKYRNELHIYHGIVETKISFDKAIRCLTANLKAHPQEFAVVVMRFEGDSPAYSDRNVWNGLMSDYLANQLPQEFKVDYRPDLTLGEVRGKLLILSRDAYADRPLTGGFISGWSHGESGTEYGTITSANGSTSALNVQDWYEVKNTDTKCNALRRFIDLASTAENGRLTINHASGYTGIGDNSGILKNASSTQPAVYRYLTSDERAEGSAGIILMDRVGVRTLKAGFKSYTVYGDLAPQAVIDNNFKFKAAR